MDQATVLEKLDEKIGRVAAVRSLARFSPEFKRWQRETGVLLQRAFGSEAYQLADFRSINFVYRGAHVMGDPLPFDRKFFAALEESVAILTSIREEIIEFGMDSSDNPPKNPMATIRAITSRFHSVARQLRKRHGDRPTLDVNDEYDVQDLLHSLLRLYFKDIRPEEWTPSYGGNSSRMDFLLKPEKLVIEVKMTRRSMSERDLVDQLLIDRGRYEIHPDCEHLVCFIYDPDGRVGNAAAIVSDLESTASDLPTRVMIFPTNE